MMGSLSFTTRLERSRHSKLLDIFFIMTLLIVHFQGSYLAFARMGWIIQSILFVLNIRYALFAVFFHTSFFNPAAFLTNDWFTVKHFHLAFAILMLVRIMKGDWAGDLRQVGRVLLHFLPSAGVIAIGFWNFFAFSADKKALMIPSNLLLVILMMTSISAIFLSYEPQLRLRLLSDALRFFLFGVLLQLAASALPEFSSLPLWKTEIIHNNHLGMLTALSLWFALYFFGFPQRRFSQAISMTVVTFIFSALVATCSRTAWISFIAVVPFWLWQAQKSCVCTKGLRVIPFLAFILTGITVALCLFNESIKSRIVKMPQIFDPAYWQYTLQDQQNFGFLGIFRLRDLHTLKQILMEHPFTGIGFVPQVVDFHGLVFLILGATGLCGFIFFLFFAGRLAVSLRRASLSPSSNREDTLAIVALCALVTWFLSMLMESYFLQFFVWIPVTVGIVYLETNKDLIASNAAPATRSPSGQGSLQGA